MNNKKLFWFLLCFLMFTSLFTSLTFAKGWELINGEWYYVDSDGEPTSDKIVTSNGKKYYLGEDGRMVRDYLLVDYNDSIYYFNDEGEMVINTWVAVDPYQVSDPLAIGPTVYLYYFGANGKAYKATNGVIRKVIDGKKYLFDERGRMLSGWINESGEMYNEIDYDEDPFVGFMYYAGDETDGVLREGWMAYEDGSIDDKYYDKEVIWFYFNNNNNKKVMNEGTGDYYQKKINGKIYAFDDNGVMLTGWEAERATKYHIDFDIDDNDYGVLAKKRWVYTVPSEEINADDYLDELERWFYADSNGDIVKGLMKKINKEYYAFDRSGILKEGLIIFDKNSNQYIDKIDIDETDGKKFIVERRYISKDTAEEKQFDSNTQVLYYFLDDESSNIYGARRTGEKLISFRDNDYVFNSEKSGQLEGTKKKKIYQAGMQIKADPSLGLGIVLDGVADSMNASAPTTPLSYTAGVLDDGLNDYCNIRYTGDDVATYYTDRGVFPHFSVVDTKGNKISSSNTYRKDKEGNYWMFGPSGTLIKIVSVPVKYMTSESAWYFKSDFYNDMNMRVETTWKVFGTPDASGYTVQLNRNEGNYEVVPDDLYALNFEFE